MFSFLKFWKCIIGFHLVYQRTLKHIAEKLTELLILTPAIFAGDFMVISYPDLHHNIMGSNTTLSVPGTNGSRYDWLLGIPKGANSLHILFRYVFKLHHHFKQKLLHCSCSFWLLRTVYCSGLVTSMTCQRFVALAS